MTIASTEEEVIVPEIVRSSDEWAEIIKGDLGRAVEGIVSAGRNLIAAKADVNHGEWLPMLKEIGISDGYARKLMSIGRAFSNRSYENDLPGNMTVLYELSRMDPEDIEDGIEHGRITPDMTIKDAKNYATGDTKPRMSINDVVNMVMAGAEASPPPAAPMPRTESSRQYDRAVGAKSAPREKAAERKQAATLSLINDLRGPWRKGITHAAKSMNASSRAYLIEALEEALNDIKEIQA